ncbi:MAG: Na+/H+ antiporter subunit E [candidate division WOR-3 bacterium]
MKKFLYFFFSLILYLLLVWTLDYQEVLAGIVASLLTAVLFGGYFSYEPNKFLQIHRWFWLLLYIPFFIWECFKANLDVALRVLHPERPINPGIVKIRTTLRSEIGRTFLANSITLTPGTMSVEIEDDNLYIHWIDVRATDLAKASLMIARPFERFLQKIFE